MVRIVDIVIVLMLVVFFISGLKRGFVRQIVEIVGLVAGVAGALFLAPASAAWLERWLRMSHDAALFVSIVVIFILIVLVFHLIGLLLKKLLNVTVLSPVDSIGGGIFGALKGVLIVSLLLLLIDVLPVPDGFRSTVRSSPVAASMRPVMPRVYDFLRERFRVENAVRVASRGDAGIRSGRAV